MHPKMYFVYILLLLLLLVPLILITCISIILMVKNSVHQSNDSTIQIKLIGRETAKFLEYNEIFDKNQKKVIKKIKYHVPKFMLELYERNKSSVKKNKTGVDLVKSLIPTQAEKIKENEIFESENHLLIFNIPEHESNEKFIEAELKVLTEIEIFSTNELGVEKIISLSIYNNSSKEYKPLYKMKIYHFNDTWVTFNLTEEVGKILHEKNEEKILNINITVSSIYPELNYFTKNNNNNLKLSLLPQIETINNYDHNYPILILSYSTTDDDLINKSINKTHLKIRKPRSVKLNEEDYEEETNLIWDDEYNNKITAKKYRKNTCKRRPLYIDFSEIKYDMWIVQPTGYDAYQCQGRCFYPLAEHLSPTKHAIMQALLNSLDPSRASKLCCVPTILDPISILYVDDKGVLTYRYAFRDMVVLDCGCR